MTDAFRRAMSDATTPEEMPRATARLMESGVELLRAEFSLALERARELSVQVLTAVLATILAAAFTEVALVLALLYPLLTRSLSSTHVLFGLALPVGLAVASIIVGAVAWGDIHRGQRASLRGAPAAEGATSHRPGALSGDPTRQTSRTERVTQ